MNETIKNWWNNNKLVFFILLPIVLIVIFRDVLFSLIAGSARELVKDSKEEDREIQQQAQAAQMEAERAKAEADALAKQREGRTTEDVSESWHLKKKS